MSYVEEIRKRIQELRERLRSRRPLAGETVLRGEPGKLIGGGKIIEQVSQGIDKIISIAREKRPNIIPTVLERIKTYEPGRRIKELVPMPAQPTPEAAPPPAETYKKVLRE